MRKTKPDPEPRIPLAGNCYMRTFNYQYPYVFRIIDVDHKAQTINIICTSRSGKQTVSDLGWEILTSGLSEGTVTKITYEEYRECISYDFS